MIVAADARVGLPDTEISRFTESLGELRLATVSFSESRFELSFLASQTGALLAGRGSDGGGSDGIVLVAPARVGPFALQTLESDLVCTVLQLRKRNEGTQQLQEGTTQIKRLPHTPGPTGEIISTLYCRWGHLVSS